MPWMGLNATRARYPICSPNSGVAATPTTAPVNVPEAYQWSPLAKKPTPERPSPPEKLRTISATAGRSRNRPSVLLVASSRPVGVAQAPTLRRSGFLRPNGFQPAYST